MEQVTRARAKRLVDFWRNRKWLSSAAPIHDIHQLDLTKLEELIAEELNLTESVPKEG